LIAFNPNGIGSSAGWQPAVSPTGSRPGQAASLRYGRLGGLRYVNRWIDLIQWAETD